MVTACEFIYLNYIDVFKSNGGSWVANIKPIYELLGGVDNHLGAYPLIALFSFLGSPLDLAPLYRISKGSREYCGTDCYESSSSRCHLLGIAWYTTQYHSMGRDINHIYRYPAGRTIGRSVSQGRRRYSMTCA